MHKFPRPVCVPVLLRQLTKSPAPILLCTHLHEKHQFPTDGQLALNSTPANWWKAGDIFYWYAIYSILFLFYPFIFAGIDELIECAR